MSALIDAGIFTAVRHDLVRWSSPSLISHRVHYHFVQAIIWLGPALIWGIIFPCSSPWGKSHVKPFSSFMLPLGHDWIKAAFWRTDGEALNYPASGKAGNGNKTKACDAPIKGRVYSFPSNSLGKLQLLQKGQSLPLRTARLFKMDTHFLQSTTWRRAGTPENLVETWYSV